MKDSSREFLMNSLLSPLRCWLIRELQKRHAILLPLRLFIGLGWLRSSIEKVVEPEWYNGIALNLFFSERIAAGDVAFPFYQSLMEGIFSTHAPLLGKIVIVGEFYCGIAILFGLFMRPALLAGIFMNLNFILAGSVNPSAFYIVIQLTLLSSNVGRIFALDPLLLRTALFSSVTPQRRLQIQRAKVMLYFCGALGCGLLAIPVAAQIQTINPAHSVEDPAMLLLILLGLLWMLLLILGGRAVQHAQNLRARRDKIIAHQVVQPMPQNPIPEYIIIKEYDVWVQAVRVERSL